MPRRSLWFVFTCFALFRLPAAADPNVIFILADDLAVNDLSLYGVTRLATNYYTLAKAFKAHGYVTGHFGKWHLGPEPYSPLQHGFDVDIPHTPAPSPLPKGFFHPFPVWKGHGNAGPAKAKAAAPQRSKTQVK